MSLKTKSLQIAAAASIAIATPLIATWEGLETQAYKDIGGVWTVCYGETEKIQIGKIYSKEECDELLRARVPDYYTSAMRHVSRDIPITMRAAITSFVYNIGEGNWKKSTMLKKVNKGDLKGACEELDRWVYVARMYVRGLYNRRQREKQLCLAELPVDI